MRLIDCQTFEFEEFYQIEHVKYAILSHRWQDDELTYQDMLGDHRRLRHKAGYQKVRAFCKKALEQRMTHVWVDTCCIDKTSSAELTEAINSMYQWYSHSTVCYAYLHDYESDPGQLDRIEDKLQSSLAACSWFYRGWTLQELIAPHMVLFYDRYWRYIDSKSVLAPLLSAITEIPEDVLTGEVNVHNLTVAERMSWASRRECTRVEDIAYSLLGLFDVNLPMLYGEGLKAFKRLQEEIIKQNNDQTIFVWQGMASSQSSLLAPHPSAFTVMWRYRRDHNDLNNYRLTNSGLCINILMQPWSFPVYIGLLECEVCTDPERNIWHRPALFLARHRETDRFVRATFRHESFALFQPGELAPYCQRPMTINIAFVGHREMFDSTQHFGIWLRSLALSPDFNGAPGQVLNQSDVYSQVQWSSKDCFFTLPAGQVGVVAIVYFPPELSIPITALKIGFDFDFQPVCAITTHEGVAGDDIKDLISMFFRGLTAVSDNDVRQCGFFHINCMETEGWDDTPGDGKDPCDKHLFALKPSKVINTSVLGPGNWPDFPVRQSVHVLCDAQQRHWQLKVTFNSSRIRMDMPTDAGTKQHIRTGWAISLKCTYLPHVVDCKLHRDSQPDRLMYLEMD